LYGTSTGVMPVLIFQEFGRKIRRTAGSPARPEFERARILAVAGDEVSHLFDWHVLANDENERAACHLRNRCHGSDVEGIVWVQGLRDQNAVEIMNRVWPSGGAGANSRNAGMNRPPGRLSTQAGVLRAVPSFSAISRATASVAPPGGARRARTFLAHRSESLSGWCGEREEASADGKNQESCEPSADEPHHVLLLASGVWPKA
jgi:hypothetical protein